MKKSFIEKAIQLNRTRLSSDEEAINEAEGELPFITLEEFNKLDPWEQQEIVDNRICPFCHGKISCLPIGDYSYIVECEDCEEIFEQE